jgi:hypothetical protein
MRSNNHGIQVVQTVSEEFVREALDSGSIPDDSVAELSDFGKLLFSEAHQRSTYIDSKLGNYLTWTSALLGILLLDQTFAKELSAIIRGLTLLPIASGFGTLAACFLGMRSELMPTPSERDWFREGIMEHPKVLCRYHLLSLLRCHQAVQVSNFNKAQIMRRAEDMLIVTATLTGLVLLCRTLLPLLRVLFA